MIKKIKPINFFKSEEELEIMKQKQVALGKNHIRNWKYSEIFRDEIHKEKIYGKVRPMIQKLILHVSNTYSRIYRDPKMALLSLNHAKKWLEQDLQKKRNRLFTEEFNNKYIQRIDIFMERINEMKDIQNKEEIMKLGNQLISFQADLIILNSHVQFLLTKDDKKEVNK